MAFLATTKRRPAYADDLYLPGNCWNAADCDSAANIITCPYSILADTGDDRATILYRHLTDPHHKALLRSVLIYACTLTAHEIALLWVLASQSYIETKWQLRPKFIDPMRAHHSTPRELLLNENDRRLVPNGGPTPVSGVESPIQFPEVRQSRAPAQRSSCI